MAPWDETDYRTAREYVTRLAADATARDEHAEACREHAEAIAAIRLMERRLAAFRRRPRPRSRCRRGGPIRPAMGPELARPPPPGQLTYQLTAARGRAR
jgi:hypothetical protein